MGKRFIFMRTALLTMTLAGITALAGCGGSSGDSGGSSPSTATMSGTAASGAPVPQDTKVYAKDANGKSATGSVIDTIGNYTVDATGLTPPIALCIDTTGTGTSSATACSSGLDDKVLIAVTDKIGTANITPMTKLAAAAAAGLADPTDLFKNPGTALKGLSSGQITQGQQAITAVMGDYLKAAGIDPASFNPLTTPFTANSKGFDSVLDKVKPTLGANGAVSIVFPGTSQGPVAIPDIRKTFASYSSSVKNGMRAAWPAIATSIAPPTGVPAIIPGSVTIPIGFAFPPNAVLPSDVRIAPGVTLPTGITIPAGVNLPPNINIPTGAILDPKLSLPAGVVIPTGVTLPPGITIPPTAMLPSSWQSAPPTGVTIPTGVSYTTPPVTTNPGTPTITSFSPASGAGGTSVTITGTNLTAVTEVLFTGPAPSTAFTNGIITAQSATSITATAPSLITAGIHTISVIYPGGEVAAVNTFNSTKGGGTPAGGGTTLTLSAPFTSISNLAYDAAMSDHASNGSTFYRRYWKNTSAEVLMIDYTNGGAIPTEPQLVVSATTTNGTTVTASLLLGGYGSCLIGNTTNYANRASCSSLGITLDRAAGTITFAATPVNNGWPTSQTNGQAGTMNGTFSFTPF